MKRGFYRCAKCDFQLSVTAGTTFHDARTPLQTWFRAIWYVTNQKLGVSALGLQRALGFGSYHTAWVWLHKLRRVMVRPDRDLLAGSIEVDETFIVGERQGKRGRGAQGKVMVVIATQKDGKRIGRIRLSRVRDGSASSLEAAVEQSAAKGSEICTDGWRGYNRLQDLGYVHHVVGPETELRSNLLPFCHRVASLLKRWILGTHQGAVRSSHLDYYLDEFTFRFNRRTSRSRGKLFYRLMQQAVSAAPIHAHKLKWKI